jgi:serine/threonine protein kinase
MDDSDSDVLREKTHSLQAGMLLRGRYELVSFVERIPERPGVEFPVKVQAAADRHARFRNASHLGQGSFGDVWKAVDRNDPRRREVALKIFYTKDRSTGLAKYLTWRNANAYEQNDLRSNAQECKLARDIVSQRHAVLGNNRICNCFEEHVMDAVGTDRAVFLVQENCGQSLQSYYWNKYKVITGWRSDLTARLEEARTLTKQMLEGLSYFMTFSPPLIHHDLKPANVCVSEAGIKIIDFGGVVFGTPKAQKEPAVATPLYQPSEVGQYRAFDFPVHSYDVYSVGLIYMEMLCPVMQAGDWYQYRTYLGQKTTLRKILRKRCSDTGNNIDKDLDLITQMVARNPRKRLSPTEALEHEALNPAPNVADVPASKVVVVRHELEGARKVAEFSTGDLVQYWSPTNKKWMDGVVSYVHADGQHLNLDTDSGTRLKHWAKISQVRRREVKMEFGVGDKVKYKYTFNRRAHWLDAVVQEVLPGTGYKVKFELNLISYYRIAKPDEVKGVEAKVEAPSARRAYRAADPSKPDQSGLITPSTDEAADLPLGAPMFLAAYKISSLVTVEEPKFTQIKAVLLMEIKVVCDWGIFPCKCDKIIVDCMKGKAREADLLQSDAGLTHFGSLKLTTGDPLKGSSCAVVPYVTSGDGGKYRGFTRWVSIPSEGDRRYLVRKEDYEHY